MKRFPSVISVAVFLFLVGISCTKINDSTELGGNLIPGVDNVNTFETSLEVRTDTRLASDTTKLSFYDDVAIGRINDPEFGNTTADAYFNVKRFGNTYPFIAVKDSVTIDSVVLSLSYKGTYGDSVTPHTIAAFEIAPTSDFSDTAFYKFVHQPDFAVAGQLGTKTFKPADLDDSITITRPRDTFKTANTVRIKLDNSFGNRLRDFDSAVFKTDSAFITNFRGFALKATGGNGLAYFNFTDTATRMIVYYKAKKNGVDSASTASFYHLALVPSSGVLSQNPANYRNGQANIIKRSYTAQVAGELAPGTEDQIIHIQSAPGTMAYITIPGLSTFANKVVHRAELVVNRIPAPGDNPFNEPSLLFLDHTKTGDTTFTFATDMALNLNGQYDYVNFGGQLRSDASYRFNLTRFVQGVITRGESNDTLRLFAPFRTNEKDKSYNTSITIPVIGKIAKGRVVVAGGNYLANPALRMRLRIIYSNL